MDKITFTIPSKNGLTSVNNKTIENITNYFQIKDNVYRFGTNNNNKEIIQQLKNKMNK